MSYKNVNTELMLLASGIGEIDYEHNILTIAWWADFEYGYFTKRVAT